MNKSLLAVGLGFVLALPVPAVFAAVVDTVQLPGHVPGVISHLRAEGHLPSTNLDLAIGLPLRNKTVLTNLLQELNDPASPNYHKYLTPAQFAEQFGPTAEDYQALADFARQNGLTITGTHGNRMLLDVRGQSTNIEKAFKINFKTYQHPKEDRKFFTTDVNPSVPSNLKVLDISGLNNLDHPRTHGVRIPNAILTNRASQFSNGTKPYGGSGQFGAFIGDDFRKAYIPGSTLNGSGQSVALVQFDGYFASDISLYESLAGRTNIPLQNVLIDGFNGFPVLSTGNAEVSLDIEMLISMAPALAKIVVYMAPLGAPQNDVFNRIAMDNSSSQIGCSWGFPGGPSGTTDQIFQQMILQGQTFFTASGDSDAYPAGTVDNFFGFGSPADNPYVTTVGGTTLTTSSNGSRVSETVWNYANFGIDGTGTGGGISSFYKIPYWQTNINMTASQGSTTFRNFPDVAMTADNVLVVANGGAIFPSAGTSCAAPLWAGFTALINQQETNYFHPPIGFINPSLYSLANTANYTNCFNDISTGSNTWSGSSNLFFAVTNYDLCTGLGTPNGTNLINALVTLSGNSTFLSNSVFKVSAPPAPYGATLANLNGNSPNGAWNLFVQDVKQLNVGIISNGWSITLTLGNPVGSVADLGMTLGSSAATVLPGSNFVYYITVTNYGGLSAATNVFVQNSLPIDCTFLSSSLTKGSISRSGSDIIWVIGNLATNAGASLALTVQSPVAAGTIIDSAIVQADTPDANPANDSSAISVTVGAPAAPVVSGKLISTNGGFTLSISGSTNSTVIQASSDLKNWIPVYTNTAPFVFLDPKRTNYQYRFYRAVTAP